MLVNVYSLNIIFSFMNLRLEKSREINKKHIDEKFRMFKHIQRLTLKERQRRRDKVTVQK